MRDTVGQEVKRRGEEGRGSDIIQNLSNFGTVFGILLEDPGDEFA
jgi:hypothetical protein